MSAPKNHLNNQPNKQISVAEAEKRQARALRRQEKRLIQGQAKLKDLQPALSRLSIPRNEQDRLSLIVSTSGESKKAQNYVACLVAPKLYRSRVPDAYARKTALFGSVMTVDVMANFANVASPDDGRFAALVQPHLGSLTTPSRYKVALVNGAGSWPTNLTLPGSFVQTSNNRDIRLDILAQRLTQPPLASAVYTSGGNGTATNPFGPSLTPQGGYGLNVNYTPSPSNFSLPPGTYLVTICLGSSAIGSPTSLTIGVTMIGDATWNLMADTNGVLTVSGTFASASATGFLTIGPGSSTLQPGSFNVFTNAASTNSQECYITFAPSFDDNVAIQGSFDYGDVAEYRPVACAALFTSATSPLITGGMVSACQLPSGAAITQFFNNGVSATGNMAAWENLAQQPGSYNGPLKDGNYVYYSPADNNDVAMYSPNDAVAHKYPTLCIAGQLVPSTPPTPGSSIMVGRLEIATVYEAMTTSQLYDSQMMLGSQAIMDQVNRHLAVQPHAMQNKKHTDFQRAVISSAPASAKNHGMPWFAQALGKAIPWAVQNRGEIADSIGMLGDLASAII